MLFRHGDFFGAASVVLAMGNRVITGIEGKGKEGSDDSPALIVWALQELVPKFGVESFENLLKSLRPDNMTPQMQMSVASAFLQADQVCYAVHVALVCVSI